MSAAPPTAAARAAHADVRHASAAALETALLDEIGRHREALRGDARGLSTPARVLVPNRAAREHWLGALCARHGSLAGVRVQTLWSAALEVLAASAAPPLLVDEPLFDALVQDAAAAEPALRAPLGAYERAYGLAAASASDLLSAGLERIESLEPVLRTLREPWGERVRALARVALVARERARGAERTRRGDVLAAAAVALEGGAPFAARPLWIVGLYDATGQLARFVDALRARGARWHLLEVASVPLAPGVETAAPATVAAEWDELAGAVGAELARGTPSARIAIAARIDAAAASTARETLELYGIAASGGEVDGRLDPRCRLALARLALAERGPAASVDAWLDAWSAEHALAPWREDLRLALRALGAARLREAAALDARECAGGAAQLALPARGRAPEAEEDGEDEAADAAELDESRPARRTLATATLAAAIDGARALVEALGAAAPAPAASENCASLERALRALEAQLGAPQLCTADLELPRGVELGTDAYRALVERRVRARCASPLFEGGSGIRFARPEQLSGLRFECVFAPGLDRGAFPRAAREDPLLPDEVRRALARVLPHLACKGERAAEEARLWRELLDGAPRVRLSCARLGADGAAATRSPYLRALARERASAPSAPSVTALPARRRFLAVAAAGAPANAEALAALFELARGEGRARTPAPAVARALAALHVERESTFAPRLSPWHGGCTRIEADAQSATFWERYAGCGWQALLTRELGLEAPPDPLGALPELDARLVGTTVHAALETLYAPSVGASLPSPAAARIDEAVRAAAADTLREQGVRLAGLARSLAARARPYVERALALAAAQGAAELVGCEQQGRCELAGTRIEFRADRVDRIAGELRFVDYKTGKSFGERAFLADVRRGRLLQAVCYAASADRARGEYWFVDPELPIASAVRSSAELGATGAAAAASALQVLRDALAHGLCLPRPTLGARSNPACERCDVASACSRADSGWRLRLTRLLERDAEPTSRGAHARAYAALAAIATQPVAANGESA